MRFCRFFIVFDSLYHFDAKTAQRANFGRWWGAAIIGSKYGFLGSLKVCLSIIMYLQRVRAAIIICDISYCTVLITHN